MTATWDLFNVDVTSDLRDYIRDNMILAVTMGSSENASVVQPVCSVFDGSLVVNDVYSDSDTKISVDFTIPVLNYGNPVANQNVYFVCSIPFSQDDDDNNVSTRYPNCGTIGVPDASGTLTIDFGSSSQIIDITTISQTPWYASNRSDVPSYDDLIKLSAYAFRAYEGIYNSYIRDNRNNPYYIDGRVEYNKWIPTNAGGADNNVYELHQVNWERDFLTTAVQSPQQGNAHLVGLTTYQTTRTAESGETVVENLLLS